MNFTRADFRGATLNLTVFWGGQFVEANMSGADLSHAVFLRTDFRSSQMHEARLGATVFADTDLNGVVGLGCAAHLSPSSLGQDTLLKSQRSISEDFLRGIGTPDAIARRVASLPR